MKRSLNQPLPIRFACCLAGIIGAGRIGQVHLDTLASVPGVKPVIISDVVEPVLKMVTEKYGVPKYTMDVSYPGLAVGLQYRTPRLLSQRSNRLGVGLQRTGHLIVITL